MAVKSSPTALAFILFTCVSRLSHSSGAVCLPTWTRHDQRLSTGGTSENINDLTSCLAFCRFTSRCVAVDFDSSPAGAATGRCWTHTDADDLTDENFYTRSDIVQYVINRDCGNSSLSGVSNCQLTWKRSPGIHSINADGMSFWTEYDCFTHCRLTVDCIAADFDIESDPPCWIHTNDDDLSPENTYDDSKTAVQYRLNRTCPAPVNSNFQLGQCVGYPMKSGNWCSSNDEIHIVKASYKTHPLCCYSPGTGDLLDVPDSAALLELDVFIQTDDQYKADVAACEGRTACALNAKTFESSYISNSFCPTRSDRTDYVSISYTCLQKGHSDPSTSTHATNERPIVLSSLGTHLISSSPPGSASDSSVPNSYIYNSNQSSNRNALILGGFGVALGGLAVIAIIVLGVCWYLRYERNAGDINHMAMNPMYANNNNNNNNNGSVISDDSFNQNRYSGGQMKGVSAVAIYPEADILSP